MKNFLRASYLLCLLILPCLISGIAMASEEKLSIPIGVPNDVLKGYYAFMAGRTPVEVTEYGGAHSRRDVIEVLLFQQALILGGYNLPLNFQPSPTDPRLTAELQAGRFAGVATSIWLSELWNKEETVYISDPVIANGEFEAGFYTSPSNTHALRAKSPDAIANLSAVSSKNWTPDWRTLSQLNLKKLHHTLYWPTMVRMVNSKRVDFLLAPFQQTDGMYLHVEGMTLVPIKGIKIGLKGSRHFAISKKHPAGEALSTALQKGLAELRTNGTIHRAYEECGFFSTQVKDWLLVTVD